MSKSEYDQKAIMYPAYDTPHKLRNISGNYTIRQPGITTQYYDMSVLFQKAFYVAQGMPRLLAERG